MQRKMNQESKKLPKAVKYNIKLKREVKKKHPSPIKCVQLLLRFTVKALIDQEVKNGIPSHRIVLGGFSQVNPFQSHFE